MNLINYNKQTREFRYSVEEYLSEEEIDLLQRVSDAKKESFTLDTLAEERNLLYDQGKEEASELISKQIQMLYTLEDLGLIQKVPIWEGKQIKDMAYDITSIGSALLNIKNKKI